MDLGVFGVEQRCRECSIRLLITGVEQRMSTDLASLSTSALRAPAGRRKKTTSNAASGDTAPRLRSLRILAACWAHFLRATASMDPKVPCLDSGFRMVLVLLLVAVWDMVFKPGL